MKKIVFSSDFERTKKTKTDIQSEFLIQAIEFF